MQIGMWSNISNTFILRELRSNSRSTCFTVVILGCLIIIFLFAFAAFGTEAKIKSSLVSVHALFRHGDRTPTFSYPNDPYINRSWPDGTGALTNKGKSQMYVLGQLLRSIYSEFLPVIYNSKELVVKSSYAPRCQMSAAVLLAGLYPPVDNQIWNEELLWQPIPTNPIPRDKDNIIAAKAHCPAFNEEKRKSDKQLTKDLNNEEKELFAYLSQHTGLKIDDISKVESLYYTLNIENDSGLSLPSWTDTVYPEPLKKIAILNLASYTWTLPLKKFQSGPLLSEWLSDLESYKKGESPLLHLYSGHDLSIINTMRSLGLMAPEAWMPDYGATLLLELHELVTPNKKTNYNVKVLYLNSSSLQKPNELVLPNCELNCPLESFKELLKPIIPANWNKECEHQL